MVLIVTYAASCFAGCCPVYVVEVRRFMGCEMRGGMVADVFRWNQVRRGPSRRGHLSCIMRPDRVFGARLRRELGFRAGSSEYGWMAWGIHWTQSAIRS